MITTESLKEKKHGVVAGFLWSTIQVFLSMMANRCAAMQTPSPEAYEQVSQADCCVRLDWMHRKLAPAASLIPASIRQFPL